MAECRSVETIEQRGTLPLNPETHLGREKEKICLEYSCWFALVYIVYLHAIFDSIFPRKLTGASHRSDRIGFGVFTFHELLEFCLPAYLQY